MPDEQPPDPTQEPKKQNKTYEYACLMRNGAFCKYTYCIEQDQFFICKDGVWNTLFELDLLEDIIKQLPLTKKWTLNSRKGIIEELKVLVKNRLINFNTSGHLNLINGLLDPWQGKLYPHNPQALSTIRLNYKFDPDAKYELWIKTLNEILENDAQKINALQEFFGYCLTRDTRMEKALLLSGESRTGKGTILHTLRALIGKDSCSSVPIKYLANPQYTSMLMNKLINIDWDVSAKAQDFEAEFKIITSGEPVSCSPKYIPTFEFNPFCKLVMAANEFPRITDHSSAFYRRLILIPCNRIFEEDEINRDLKQQLTEELPGILNWALEGLQRVNGRNGFLQYDFMKEAVEELREDSNPIDVFLRESIVINTTSKCEVVKSELYDRYKTWANKIMPDNAVISIIKFNKCVYRKFSKSTEKDSQSFITGKRIWKNLSYNEGQNKGWDKE